jgi:hypothetical protein|tara:strand:- start:15 stop:596 length:582 start_codon:yes stop_codon:yes gene_type:complete
MTKIIKNSKSYNDFITYINNSKVSYNKLQTNEIELSNNIGKQTLDFTFQVIQFISTCKVKKEVMQAKKIALSNYNIHATSKTRVELAFRIAGSEVIKQKLKDNNNNITKLESALKKDNKELSQTSINKYKNARKVDNNKIVLKDKKNKVISKKVELITPLEIQYNKYDERQLQAIIDNCHSELDRRGQEAITL